jgi:DNA primase
MIPEPVVDEVRARADIVEVVGEQVPLKKAGKEFKGLCPFHQERTPSFYVVPAKGFYKCFGCGESGDVFTFLMKRQGLGFQDAVRHVAGRVGVEIPDVRADRQEVEAHRLLYEAIAFAADFYQRQLREGAAGERARAYLERRSISQAAAERYLLGAAPDAWRGLREAAHRHGISDEVLLEAGLVKVSDRAERADDPYDRLRDRLIFPITDIGGRVVAFGGRTLGPSGEGAPKYLNSPETPIYHKGGMLYGLTWSRSAIRREEAALVVEGYMDYVSLAAAGVEHVVAALGTAMTVEQAALLGRYTEQALLLYDSDAAGLRATFRTADALLRAGVHPLVVTLPPGEDPDSVVRTGGAAALKPHLAAAVDVLDRKLQILQERGYFQDIDGVRKAVDALLPTVRAAADPALRDIYTARVAERTGVRRETLESEAAAPERVQAQQPRSRPIGQRSATGRGSGVRVSARGASGQRKLLLVLLRDESRIAAAGEALRPEDFPDPIYRDIFAGLLRSGGLRGGDPSELGLSAEALKELEELRGDPEDLTDAERIFAGSIDDIRAESLFHRLTEIDGSIGGATERGDDEAILLLTMEKKRIMEQLRGMRLSLEPLLRKVGRRAHGRPTTGEAT